MAPDHVEVPEEVQLACKDAILAVFPDICPDFLGALALENDFSVDAAVSHIADLLEGDKAYPKRPPKATIKRKRSSSSETEKLAEAEIGKRFCTAERRAERKHHSYLTTARAALRHTFPLVPCKQLDQMLSKNDNCLFPTMRAMREALDQAAGGGPAVPLKKKPSKGEPKLVEPGKLENWIQTARPEIRLALEEFKADQELQSVHSSKADAEARRHEEEEEYLRAAEAEGTTADCECCYGTCAKNRMVYCDAAEPHYFCRDCARRNAETQIGMSKHQLLCLSMDDCSAGFPLEQKLLFLDDKLRIALDRIEQEDVLRQAGIENLETCPFCPFAAECVPAEIDKEFRCQNPECEIVSCRLCREKTHIPRTCQEAALENGHSARHNIEEAMSAAMIRHCNKCSTPFIKELGCNRMTCTRASCGTQQCYICHQSIKGYDHFNDPTRGGKSGNCPLFDSVENRHDEEVRAAEEKARQEAADANPDMDQGLLRINFSEKIKQDDARRKAKEPPPIPGRLPRPGPIARPGVPLVPAGAAPEPLAARVDRARKLARAVHPRRAFGVRRPEPDGGEFERHAAEVPAGVQAEAALLQQMINGLQRFPLFVPSVQRVGHPRNGPRNAQPELPPELPARQRSAAPPPETPPRSHAGQPFPANPPAAGPQPPNQRQPPLPANPPQVLPAELPVRSVDPRKMMNLEQHVPGHHPQRPGAPRLWPVAVPENKLPGLFRPASLRQPPVPAAAAAAVPAPRLFANSKDPPLPVFGSLDSPINREQPASGPFAPLMLGRLPAGGVVNNVAPAVVPLPGLQQLPGALPVRDVPGPYHQANPYAAAVGSVRAAGGGVGEGGGGGSGVFASPYAEGAGVFARLFPIPAPAAVEPPWAPGHFPNAMEWEANDMDWAPFAQVEGELNDPNHPNRGHLVPWFN